MSLARSLGEYIVTPAGLAPTLATAGGANAATDLLTPAIDRTLYGMPQSCVIDANMASAVASGKTCTVTLRLQHCDTSGGSYVDFNNSGGGYATAGPTPPTNAGEQTLVITNALQGSNHIMAFFNLTGAKRFIKAVINSTFTAANTDTNRAAISVVLGGLNELGVTDGGSTVLQPANT